MIAESFWPSASSTSSKTARASGKASPRSLPMPTAWLPCPGNVNAMAISPLQPSRDGGACGAGCVAKSRPGAPSSSAEEVGLAEWHAIVPQNGVGRGDVEIEVRRGEMQEVLQAREFHLAAAELQHDLLFLRAVDVGRREGLQITLHLLDPRQ